MSTWTARVCRYCAHHIYTDTECGHLHCVHGCFCTGVGCQAPPTALPMVCARCGVAAAEPDSPVCAACNT